MRERQEGFAWQFGASLAVSLVLVLALAVSAQGAVGDTMLVSRGSGPGVGGAGNSGEQLATSNSGRYVAFVSEAANLSVDALAGVKNVYLRDVATNEVTLVSRADGATGAAASGDSGAPAVSPGGRFVAFESIADNLSADDDDAVSNVYLRDTTLGTTELVSRANGASGITANGDSRNPALSQGAKSIAFESDADNLAAAADPNVTNVFVREKGSHLTKLVSLGSPTLAFPDGVPADGNSSDPSISSTGDRVAFQSAAANLSTKDDDAVTDVFVRDLKTRSIFEVSCRSRLGLDRCPIPAGEGPVDGHSTEPALSWDGGFVAFQSDATNLVPEQDGPAIDVFVRGLSAGTTRLVSRASGADGAPAAGASFGPSVSGEGQGQFVAFVSAADNLSDQDVGTYDVFVRDALNGTTVLASRASGASGAAAAGSSGPTAISGDGRFLAFSSEGDNLSAADDDVYWNVFLRALDPNPPPPPVVPPPPPPGHCHFPPCPEEEVHYGTDHAAGGQHSAGGAAHGAEHGAEHAHDASSPTQTLFAPRTQDIDRLYVMVQVHEASTLAVKASVTVPGRAARLYRFRSYTRKLPIHAVRRIRLKLAQGASRSVKRALEQGRRLRVRVTARAVDAAGNRGLARRTIRLRP